MKHEPTPVADIAPFHFPISHEIWDKKYRFQDSNGAVHDVTVQDTWKRIARALASVEGDNVRGLYEQKFFDALENWQYLPAGRITAGAGTGRDVTLFNCFVMGTIPDSMAGIFEMLKEAALTMQQGGGIGYDFSTIRPKGTLVKGVGSDASGPLSFMDCWDSMWMLCTRSKQPPFAAPLAARHESTPARRPAAENRPTGAPSPVSSAPVGRATTRPLVLTMVDAVGPRAWSKAAPALLHRIRVRTPACI